MKINTRNWTTSGYQKGEMVSFISIGGDIGSAEPLYFVTTTDLDRKIEHFQEEFEQLEWAIETINARFGHWAYIDLENLGHGCSC